MKPVSTGIARRWRVEVESGGGRKKKRSLRKEIAEDEEGGGVGDFGGRTSSS